MERLDIIIIGGGIGGLLASYRLKTANPKLHVAIIEILQADALGAARIPAAAERPADAVIVEEFIHRQGSLLLYLYQQNRHCISTSQVPDSLRPAHLQLQKPFSDPAPAYPYRWCGS